MVVDRNSGNATSATAARSTVTIAYDLPSRGYTITAGNRSITFLPADIDAEQSNAAVVVYQKQNGNTVDSLTLTRGGTSGRFTFQYVGGGFWESATENANTINGTVDAFVYGFPTAVAAVPRTGKGSYDVDLIGVISPNQGITGSGQLQVLFDTGTILISGSLDPGAVPPNSSFSGTAQLGAGRTFTGSFGLDAFGTFSGSIDGGFYGPQGQEVGGAFAVAETGGGRRAVGTILGRGGPQTASNTSLKSQTVNDFYVGEGGRLAATLTGSSGSNTGPASYSGLNAAEGDFTVNYNAASQAYTVVAGSRSATGDSSLATTIERFGLLDTFQAFARTSPNQFPTNRFNELEYVAAARWFKQTGVGNNSDYLIDELAFGITTPNAALPRTGQGGYAIGVFGTAADPDASNLMLFAGQGTLLANFGTGAITLNAGINYAEDIQLSGVTQQRASGTLTGTASLSASSNAFAGTVTLTGLGNYNGTLSGSFFGPGADEVGGGFGASDGAGRLVGSFVGERDDSILAAGQPLLQVPSPTTFAPFANAMGDGVNRAPEGTAVTYSPDTASYRVTVPQASLDLPGSSNFDRDLLTAFGPGNRLASQTNATFTVSEAGLPSKRVTGRLFNPGSGNPALALTYTSFVEITSQPLDPGGQPSGDAQRLYLPFGVATPNAGLPRTGTGSYGGVAYGHGRVGGSPQFAVTGTSTLNADFSAATFTAALNLTNSSNGQAFAPFNFQGSIATNGFFGNGVVSPPAGQVGNAGTFNGNFFGPAANEFGAVFDAIRSEPGGQLFITGVTVGKKN